MKKSTKTLVFVLAAICVAAVIALVAINRNANKAERQLVNAKQLSVVVGAEEKVYDYVESGEQFVSFSTQMKRKNGDVFDKEYNGILLSDILQSCGAEIADATEVTATCGDNYQIILTGAEILADGNVYLVTQENGRPLDAESGTYMLVINNDEFSTRWGKDIISISVK